MGATSDDFSTVGRRIKHLRKTHGVRQETVAEWAGVHVKTVSRWENDAQPPEYVAFEKMAAGFRVAVDWIRLGPQAHVHGPPLYGERTNGDGLQLRDEADAQLAIVLPELAALVDRAAKLLRLRLGEEPARRRVATRQRASVKHSPRAKGA